MAAWYPTHVYSIHKTSPQYYNYSTWITSTHPRDAPQTRHDHKSARNLRRKLMIRTARPWRARENIRWSFLLWVSGDRGSEHSYSMRREVPSGKSGSSEQALLSSPWLHSWCHAEKQKTNKKTKHFWKGSHHGMLGLKLEGWLDDGLLSRPTAFISIRSLPGKASLRFFDFATQIQTGTRIYMKSRMDMNVDQCQLWAECKLRLKKRFAPKKKKSLIILWDDKVLMINP